MMKQHRIFKMTAIVLTVFMLLSVMPVSLYAQGRVPASDAEAIQADRSRVETIPDDTIVPNDSTLEETPQKEAMASNGVNINGVYAIRKAGTNVYAQNTTLDSLAWVFQEVFSSPPVSESDRDYLFKIAYRSAKNDYVIRSMSNNAIILYPSETNDAPVAGKVNVSGAPATDSNLSTGYTWKIDPTGDGFYRIWYNSDGTIYYMRSASNSGDGPILSWTTNPNDSGIKWTFHQYTGDPIDGTGRINFEYTLIPGESYTHKAYMYSSTIGRNGPVSYSSQNTSVFTVNSSSGLVTAIAPGNANLWITYPGAPWMWGWIATITKVFQVECYNKKGYWDVPNSSTSRYIECNEKNQLQHSVWLFENQGNNYYAIRNYSTGYYVKNDGNELAHVSYSSASFSNSLLWKLIRQDDGSYKIQSKLNSSYYIAEENVNHITNDPDIILSNSNDDSSQKWFLNSKTFSVSINNYYDYSMQMRMESSLSANNTTLSEINNRQKKLNDYLFSEYGIVVKNNTPTRRISYADMCHGVTNINPSSINSECSHGSVVCDGRKGLCDHVLSGSGTCNSSCSSAYHHNNSLKIHSWFSHELSSPSADINILWTGHRNCNCGSANVPWSSGTYITAILYNSTDTRYRDYTAFHEVGHSLGASGDAICESTSCVMAYATSWATYFSLLQNPGSETFCDECTMQIRKNVHSKY